MKLSALAAVLVGTIVPVLGQTIELGAPTQGAVITRGVSFTAQVIKPESMASFIQVGIALAIAPCPNGVCPQPSEDLGSVLYAGPWTPTPHTPGGFYQNFTFQLDEYATPGENIFTLTHFGLFGVAPYPFIEYRTATVTVV